MPPRSNKTIFAMYAAVFGGFVYVLWTIAARSNAGGSAASATVAMEVNNVIVERRNSLIQQSVFRAQVAAKAQPAVVVPQQTVPVIPTYTPPVQTYVPPTPMYVRPRTTIS